MYFPSGRKVLLKVDWNIPSLTETDRIIATLPTIQALLSNNNTIIIATHWGRPDGKREMNYSIENLLPTLHQILQQHSIDAPTLFVDQTLNFDAARNTINSCGLRGVPTIVILENTRFLDAEQSEDVYQRTQLAQQYSQLAEYMVDEAFSLSHRKEATNTEIKLLLPHAFGLQYQQEVAVLNNLKQHPKRPFLLCIGGAKLETKLPLIQHLIEKVDAIFVGGQMVFTFLHASGREVFDSFIEEKYSSEVQDILARYKHKIVLPEFINYITLEGKKVGVDIKPESITAVEPIFQSVKTIFWNGCMGWVEQGYTQGNDALADMIVASPAYKVVGGGDTVASLTREVTKRFDFVSTGGGATLQFLAS